MAYTFAVLVLSMTSFDRKAREKLANTRKNTVTEMSDIVIGRVGMSGLTSVRMASKR